MIFLMEAIILCILFTWIVVPSVYKNPLAWAADYPPKIVARLQELGQIPKQNPILTPKVLARKLIFCALAIVSFGFMIFYINGAQSFWEGFTISYGLWLTIVWFDALILDCLWFTHSKKIRIPGTEDMVKEYKDCWFHIRMSIIGSLIGLPVCLLAGGFVKLLLQFR